MKPPTTAWHYTVTPKLDAIAASKFLVPTGVRTAPGEQPALWFSTNPVWEPTATKMLALPGGTIVQPTKDELHTAVGLCRFALTNFSQILRPFAQLVRVLRVPPAEVQRLIGSGVAMGAKPIDWWGCREAIPLERLTLEIWSGDSWEPGLRHINPAL